MADDLEKLRKKYKLGETEVNHFWETYPDEAKKRFEFYKKTAERLKNQGKKI